MPCTYAMVIHKLLHKLSFKQAKAGPAYTVLWQCNKLSASVRNEPDTGCMLCASAHGPTARRTSRAAAWPTCSCAARARQAAAPRGITSSSACGSTRAKGTARSVHEPHSSGFAGQTYVGSGCHDCHRNFLKEQGLDVCIISVSLSGSLSGFSGFVSGSQTRMVRLSDLRVLQCQVVCCFGSACSQNSTCENARRVPAFMSGQGMMPG